MTWQFVVELCGIAFVVLALVILLITEFVTVKGMQEEVSMKKAMAERLAATG